MSDLPMPKGWAQASLSDLANFTNGKAFKKEEWLESGKPIIRIQNLNNPSAKFNYADDYHEEKYLVRNGDLLVSWSASLGVYYWNSGDAWLNQHIFRVDKLRGCDKNYLKYALEISIKDFYTKAHGMGMVHITKGNFESHLVPLPPIAEQTRIAAKLDGLLAQVYTLKARIDGISGLIKRFRQSVLAAAISGRLTDSISETYALELLGKLVAEPLRNGKSVKDGVGQRVLRLSALKKNNIDFFQSKAGNWTGVNFEQYIVKHNDFLISRGNGSKALVGRGGLARHVTDNVAYPDTMIRVRPDTQKLLPKFLAIIWNSYLVRQQIESTARTTAGIWKISQGDLEVLQIPLPSLVEQRQIVRRVEQLFAFADQLEVRVKAAQARIDRLTQSILAKAFRGELVPQDPNDEPASVLLDRIKAQRASAPKAKRGRQAANPN